IMILRTMKKTILAATACMAVTVVASAQGKRQDKGLIEVAAFGKSMAIGLSVTSDNRVFVAFPGYNGNGKLALAEEKNGKLYPYPDLAWNTKKGNYREHFLRVQ